MKYLTNFLLGTFILFSAACSNIRANKELQICSSKNDSLENEIIELKKINIKLAEQAKSEAARYYELKKQFKSSDSIPD